MGVRLRSLLTSSHKPSPEPKPDRWSWYVFKRPHSSASRIDLVTSSPGRRRLRFSFQINDVKDPTGVSGPTV